MRCAHLETALWHGNDMQISIDIIAFDARSGPKRIECQCEMTGSLNSAAFLLKGDAGEDIPG